MLLGAGNRRNCPEVVDRHPRGVPCARYEFTADHLAIGRSTAKARTIPMNAMVK